MKIVVPENSWSCILVAMSMVTGVSLGSLKQYLGHDGSSQPYPNSDARHGFTIYEIIQVAYDLHWNVTPFQFYPEMQHSATTTPIKLFPNPASEQDAIRRVLTYGNGIITGRRNTIGHAVAWVNGLVADPSGPATTYVYKFDGCAQHKFDADIFWLFQKAVV